MNKIGINRLHWVDLQWERPWASRCLKQLTLNNGGVFKIDYNESHGTFHDDKTYSYLRETKPDRIVK